MKRLLFLFAFALLLVACSSEEPTELEVVSQELDNENETDNTEEDDDNPDEGPNKELERSMTLIPPSLDEMAEWNSFIAYSVKRGYFQDSDFDYEHSQVLQYVASQRAVYIEIDQPDMLIKNVRYKGTDQGEDWIHASQSYDNEDFIEIDPTTGVLKDHLQFRYELLSLAHKHGINREAKIDHSYITETMTIPAEHYEEFASLLREIIDIEATYNLDMKTDFKNVIVSITLDGISLYEYTVHIQYPDDDIDGATDFTFRENFESVDEFDEIEYN